MATIFDACEYGSLERLHQFIQQGLMNGKSLSDIVNAKDYNCSKQCALLHIAIIFKQKSILCELLRHQADVNIEDIGGRTPLYYAINYKYFDVIDVVSLYNVDLNKPDHYGWTPLHEAAVGGKIKIVKDLLNRGADYTLSDHKGRTAKDLAVISLRSLIKDGFQTKHIQDYQPIIELLQSYEEIPDVKEQILWRPFLYNLFVRA